MRHTKVFGPIIACALAAGFLYAAPGARAEVPTTSAKSPDDAQPSVLPRDGVYYVTDDLSFTLIHHGSVAVLRFEGDDEIYALVTEPAQNGGRILKYDNGETVMRVTRWSGVTLYTDERPGGIPAARVGDGVEPMLTAATLSQLHAQSAALAAQLKAAGAGDINFDIEWLSLADDRASRSYVMDAMKNAAKAILRTAKNAKARAALAAKLKTVRIRPGTRAVAGWNGETLAVTYSAKDGIAGRVSSLAIAQAMRTN